MARDYNADYDNEANTWEVYYKKLKDDGMTDDQIESELSGTKWNIPGSKYAGWANGIRAKRDTLEARTPEAEQLIKAQTREQFANDNDAYRNALSSKGVTPGNSTGKVRSIQQAYYDGLIDKGTRDYMMADSIAKFARNTGRDIGNIGAQYTGGAINNNYEEADWNKRNDELFKQQTSAEAGTIANSDKNIERRQQEANLTGKGLENEKANTGQLLARRLKEEADKAYKAGDTKRGDTLTFAATKAANGTSVDELLTLLLGSRDDPPEGEQTFEQFQKDNPDWTQEEFNELQRLKRQAREGGDANEVAVKKYVNKINGEHEAKRKADEKAKIKEEKDLKKQQEKEAKAAKKQQEKEAAAAKVKSGYQNSYNNMIRNYQAGDKNSLGQAWANYSSGRNPFDRNSFINDVDTEAIEKRAQQAFANVGKDWKNPDGTPSDEYKATVLKYLLESM